MQSNTTQHATTPQHNTTQHNTTQQGATNKDNNKTNNKPTTDQDTTPSTATKKKAKTRNRTTHTKRNKGAMKHNAMKMEGGARGACQGTREVGRVRAPQHAVRPSSHLVMRPRGDARVTSCNSSSAKLTRWPKFFCRMPCTQCSKWCTMVERQSERGTNCWSGMGQQCWHLHCPELSTIELALYSEPPQGSEVDLGLGQ